MQKWGCRWDVGTTWDRDGEPGELVKGARIRDSSNTGMLQLPECRAQTHRVGKGSREGGLGQREGEKGGHGEGAGEKHKRFHIAIGWGTSPFGTFQKNKTKQKKPQTPCQTKRAIM